MSLLLEEFREFNGALVSNCGRVISATGRELTPTTLPKGYKSVGIQIGRSHSVRIARLVAELFVVNPDPINFNQVDHIDGVPGRDYAGNLRWVNNAINNKHKFELRRRRGLPLHTPRELAAIERRRIRRMKK